MAKLSANAGLVPPDAPRLGSVSFRHVATYYPALVPEERSFDEILADREETANDRRNPPPAVVTDVDIMEWNAVLDRIDAHDRRELALAVPPSWMAL